MLFNSLQFLIFFPIVVLMYFIIPKKIRYIWLLISSYYFYMCWNAKYALLLFFSTFVTYLSGVLLEKVKVNKVDSSDSEKNIILKKWIVAGSFILNLAILFFFKYYSFASDLLTSLFALFHVELHVPVLDVLLPVGISFYTFQALSYTMDVYRGDIYAEKNFFRYALFVSFFPQLVAGPIERSKNLLKQLAVPAAFDKEKITEGLLLMVWGFFLKLVLADRAAIFVNTVYGDIASYSGSMLAVATILFAMQIYCDFSGYSIIAIGCAKILGIDLMENFKAPYLSGSVSSFWRNWHISLTSWFKDYLYIPLGGSRKGTARKYLNKVIVFTVSGLWHGANLTFVIWGLLNGLYQVLGEILTPVRNMLVKAFKVKREGFIHRFLCCCLTFFLVTFSWIFFRAVDLSQAAEVIRLIAISFHGADLINGSLFSAGLDLPNMILLTLCIAVLLAADILKVKGIVIRSFVMKWNYWGRFALLLLGVMAVLVFGIWGAGYDASNFIYFQF